MLLLEYSAHSRIPACEECFGLFTFSFYRLDRSDADFVDVIHTAGKWVGTHRDMGHVDFFPNLGEAPQPGCENKESLDLSCSHFMVRLVP